ncbi:MAG: hypothetical protein CMJ64_15680 [Planctomycetaceae bacterium]|nr:hypothetical protein [Planctomycetaceae bacterium]
MTRLLVRFIGFVIVVPGMAVVLSGCGGRSAPSVAGTVTLDGAPLGEALVSFMPANKELSAAIASTDLEGQYTLEQGVEGVVEGTYTVHITTYRPAITEIDPPIPGIKEKVPAGYNVRSTLNAEVSSGENVLDFPLDSKGQIVQPQENY